jgi:hypothetical protein
MWGKELAEVSKKISEKYGLSEFLVRDSIEHMFMEVKRSLQDESMPKVLLHNFGTFRPKLHLLKNKILWYEKRLEEGKILKDEYEIKVLYLQNVINRLTKEKTK